MKRLKRNVPWAGTGWGPRARADGGRGSPPAGRPGAFRVGLRDSHDLAVLANPGYLVSKLVK